jgi:hypothetical protein
MILFWMVWSLAAVWLLAKVDKKLTIKVGGKIEKKERWDDLIEYYNGRVTIYKVLLVLSFIPFLNAFIATVANIITVVLIGALIAKSSFWQKGFWSKVF